MSGSTCPRPWCEATARWQRPADPLRHPRREAVHPEDEHVVADADPAVSPLEAMESRHQSSSPSASGGAPRQDRHAAASTTTRMKAITVPLMAA